MKQSRQPRNAFALWVLLLLAASAVVTLSFQSSMQVPTRLRTPDEPQQLASSVATPTAKPPSPPPPPRSLNVSVLHPRTAEMPRLRGERLRMTTPEYLDSGKKIVATTKFFAQHGTDQRGVHYSLQNTALVDDAELVAKDSLLLIVVLNDNSSWGSGRNSEDFFRLIGSFSHPKSQTSLTLLTSSMDEFRVLQGHMLSRIKEYAQLSLLFRNDFKMSGLSRANRQDDSVQYKRRSMLARYRNFALLSTLQDWHQHVVWLDADVHIVPAGLVTKMILADRDILEPICLWDKPPSTNEYDRNAWAGIRKVPKDDTELKGFVPNNVDVRFMGDYRDKPEQFVPLDSVGGTMLYVRADIHRQGVVFAHHYAVGTTWDHDGYDAIETEGLCYSAHFLGYKCWGMPHDAIYHVAG